MPQDFKVNQDIFITQRGGKIQLEPIKAYARGSFEYPMQPILLDNNLAAVQDTFLYEIQDRHLLLSKKLGVFQAEFEKWTAEKQLMIKLYNEEKDRYNSHKEKFTKFIEENRVKMKRSQRKAEEEIKTRIETEAKIKELQGEIQHSSLEMEKLVADCKSKKDLEIILENTIKHDTKSTCYRVSTWISHAESLLEQHCSIKNTVSDSRYDGEIDKNPESKRPSDSKIDIGFEENPTSSLETSQIKLCIETLCNTLHCKSEYLHYVIKDFADTVQ
eukprot:NODE_19_length_47148_cov_1.447810.p22 type:complete len:273 gc:universal NODE_19_length_47148_cov_1.447810:21986-22804(+)